MYDYFYPFHKGDKIRCRNGCEIVVDSDNSGYWFTLCDEHSVFYDNIRFEDILWDCVVDENGDSVEYVEAKTGDVFCNSYDSFELGLIVKDVAGQMAIVRDNGLSFNVNIKMFRKEYLVGNIYDIAPNSVIGYVKIQARGCNLDNKAVFICKLGDELMGDGTIAPDIDGCVEKALQEISMASNRACNVYIVDDVAKAIGTSNVGWMRVKELLGLEKAV